MNLGWRRRKEKSIYGFNIDTTTGFWSRDDQASDDNKEYFEKDARYVERITPYVEDRRNVLILRPGEQIEEDVLVSLQYALKRGIEEEFQIEESELISEPLPHRDDRRAVLFYEAAEGGAGVLTRLTTDETALSRIANRALKICHFETEDNWNTHINTNAACEAGCYRCLLSYYNQPDHELIDRQNPKLITLLKHLANARLKTSTAGRTHKEQAQHLESLSGSTLEDAFIKYLKRCGHRLPDDAQVAIEKFKTRPDFIYRSPQQVAIYIDGPHHEYPQQKNIDDALTKQLEDTGLMVIRFPKEQQRWATIIARYPDIFGAIKEC